MVFFGWKRNNGFWRFGLLRVLPVLLSAVLTVPGDVFATEGFVDPFLFFVAVVGAAVGFAALTVGVLSADVVGALAVVGSALGGGAVMVFGAGGLVFGDFFLFG